MAVLKCKMCGGTLEILDNSSVTECEYCGAKQTVPKFTDDNLQSLYNRANNLRIKCEFDKAESLYEKLVQADSTQAEAYWGLVLCKYGVEYVDDPATYKKIPTCHRTCFDEIFADYDYKAAMANADSSQRLVYEEQARDIDRIQNKILSLAKNNENYDIFICYKETDETGNRTRDSVYATQIYHMLTKEGYKVFFSRITLEDKLGTEYEPYIFSALRSAKVMIVIGTNPSYFESTWVRNEWSRYLALIKKGENKTLIPAFRDMDPADMPSEFSYLQALNMDQIGFSQDLLHGIEKIVGKSKTNPSAETATDHTVSHNMPSQPRDDLDFKQVAERFLAAEDWFNLSAASQKQIRRHPYSAEGYMYSLLFAYKVKSLDELANRDNLFERSDDYKKLYAYSDEQLKQKLDQLSEKHKKHLRTKIHDIAYVHRCTALLVIFSVCQLSIAIVISFAAELADMYVMNYCMVGLATILALFRFIFARRAKKRKLTFTRPIAPSLGIMVAIVNLALMISMITSTNYDFDNSLVLTSINLSISGFFLLCDVLVGLCAPNLRFYPEDIKREAGETKLALGRFFFTEMKAIFKPKSKAECRCGRCGAVLKNGSHFCSSCGYSVGADSSTVSLTSYMKICKYCGAQLPGKAAFCNQCGARYED